MDARRQVCVSTLSDCVMCLVCREHAPSIIFMDEIDSIGSQRADGSDGGRGDSGMYPSLLDPSLLTVCMKKVLNVFLTSLFLIEVQRTMMELLNQLDGFESTQNIKIIMCTNRIDVLDDALLRPGRIDRKIEFPAPNADARKEILKIHSRRMNLVRGIDLGKIATDMHGASGAEVKAACTEAGMFALRERRVHVTQEDFEMAVAKVIFTLASLTSTTL